MSANSQSVSKNDYRIKIEGPTEIRQGEAIPISGKFRIPFDHSGVLVTGPDILKHIVLAVTRSGNYQTSSPFKDVAVFPDDIKKSKKGWTGFFKFNVFNHIGFAGEGDYYILCSLGIYTSNIVKIVVI